MQSESLWVALRCYFYLVFEIFLGHEVLLEHELVEGIRRTQATLCAAAGHLKKADQYKAADRAQCSKLERFVKHAYKRLWCFGNSYSPLLRTIKRCYLQQIIKFLILQNTLMGGQVLQCFLKEVALKRAYRSRYLAKWWKPR